MGFGAKEALGAARALSSASPPAHRPPQAVRVRCSRTNRRATCAKSHQCWQAPPSPRQHEPRSFVTANGSFIPIIALFPIYNSTQTVRDETQAPLSTLRASPPTKLTQTPTREKELRQRGSFWKQSLCSRTLYTLNLKCMTSPSCTTYSLPSWRSLPALRQPNSPPSST